MKFISWQPIDIHYSDCHCRIDDKLTDQPRLIMRDSQCVLGSISVGMERFATRGTSSDAFR